MKTKNIILIFLISLIALSFIGCTTTQDNKAISNNVPSIENSILDTTILFTERDSEQTADLSEAISIILENDDDNSLGYIYPRWHTQYNSL